MNKVQKILYLTTMVTFTVGIMVILYFSNYESLLSFCLGLCVCICSEHIAKLFLVIGDKFNLIIINVVKTWIGVDLSEELKDEEKPDDKSTDKKLK